MISELVRPRIADAPPASAAPALVLRERRRCLVMLVGLHGSGA
jgi:hypothetical protein